MPQAGPAANLLWPTRQAQQCNPSPTRQRAPHLQCTRGQLLRHSLHAGGGQQIAGGSGQPQPAR